MAPTEAALLREMVLAVMKFLEELNYKETVHKLEQESGYFFNMMFFEDRVKAGEWDEVERYLSGFTKLEDNKYSRKTFFEIRKQKYLEALDRHESAKAFDILRKDLKVFASFKEEILKGILIQLLTLDNFRQHEQFNMYTDMESARNMMLSKLKKHIEANPLFRDKLEFPPFEDSGLRTLINRSLNWRHQLYKNPSADPEIKTLFTDHSFRPANEAAHVPPPTNSPLPLELIPVRPLVNQSLNWQHPLFKSPLANVELACFTGLRLPDSSSILVRVVCLKYANSGASLLVLDRNGLHKLWKWNPDDRKLCSKCTTQRWRPCSPSKTPMTNDKGNVQPAACIALTKQDSYLLSVSGGKVSLLKMETLKVVKTFMVPPPTATFLAFLPQDNHVFAVGMDDSTIQIYNLRLNEVTKKLEGHQERITGLAFSESLNVLVSSGADAQLRVWSIDGWEKKKSKSIKPPLDCPSLTGETKIQFNKDQTRLLVVHEFLIAVYDSELRCSCMWSPWSPGGLNRNAIITSAVYSCDGLLVYAGFTEGVVGVFDADRLRLRGCIQTSVPQSVPSNFPTVIAAHPSEPSRIALGMSDGTVYLMEKSAGELERQTDEPLMRPFKFYSPGGIRSPTPR